MQRAAPLTRMWWRVACVRSQGKVRPGCVAAFSVEANDSEMLVIVFEIRANSEKEAAATCREAQSAVMKDVGVAPGRVVALKEKTIPKTTSGKIQRRATRAALDAATLKVVFDTAPDGKPDAAAVRASPEVTKKRAAPAEPSEDMEGSVAGLLPGAMALAPEAAMLSLVEQATEQAAAEQQPEYQPVNEAWQKITSLWFSWQKQTPVVEVDMSSKAKDVSAGVSANGSAAQLEVVDALRSVPNRRGSSLKKAQVEVVEGERPSVTTRRVSFGEKRDIEQAVPTDIETGKEAEPEEEAEEEESPRAQAVRAQRNWMRQSVVNIMPLDDPEEDAPLDEPWASAVEKRVINVLVELHSFHNKDEALMITDAAKAKALAEAMFGGAAYVARASNARPLILTAASERCAFTFRSRPQLWLQIERFGVGRHQCARRRRSDCR
jgi:hypothetical protein